LTSAPLRQLGVARVALQLVHEGQGAEAILDQALHAAQLFEHMLALALCSVVVRRHLVQGLRIVQRRGFAPLRCRRHRLVLAKQEGVALVVGRLGRRKLIARVARLLSQRQLAAL
jgi:hypothetical protein